MPTRHHLWQDREPSRPRRSHYEGQQLSETARHGLKSFNDIRAGTTAGALAIGVLSAILAATPAASAQASKRSTTHSAYGLQLSIPDRWAVSYFQNCSIRTTGTLLIGAPTYLSNCTSIPADANVISIQPQPLNAVVPGTGEHLAVHGVKVISYSTGPKSSGGTTWVVPSKHVVLTATGPQSSAVLHTLAVATPRSISAPGMLRGSVYLVALMRTPITGPVSVTRVSSHGTGSIMIQAYDGQFWETLPPGIYLLTSHAGDAPCPAVRVTVQSGQPADAPEIDCKGE